MSHRLTLVELDASVKGEFKTNLIYQSYNNGLENMGIKATYQHFLSNQRNVSSAFSPEVTCESVFCILGFPGCYPTYAPGGCCLTGGACGELWLYEIKPFCNIIFNFTLLPYYRSITIVILHSNHGSR